MFIMRLGADHPAFIPKEDTKCILEISNCHMFNILTVIFKNNILKATFYMIMWNKSIKINWDDFIVTQSLFEVFLFHPHNIWWLYLLLSLYDHQNGLCTFLVVFILQNPCKQKKCFREAAKKSSSRNGPAIKRRTFFAASLILFNLFIARKYFPQIIMIH